jgi:hypothetical protein
VCLCVVLCGLIGGPGLLRVASGLLW